ncbi:hypothetical protein D9757_011688 [Collybiopsis confluens]|uniref:Uncharacterized protein n=1 Tax=Collybiopsis confluens TaxID=2823264 RepID=A0A8H5LS04_9AGAR|nr:hypothetical protein D9757_011688 [Collybiopsis confluens]
MAVMERSLSLRKAEFEDALASMTQKPIQESNASSSSCNNPSSSLLNPFQTSVTRQNDTVPAGRTLSSEKLESSSVKQEGKPSNPATIGSQSTILLLVRDFHLPYSIILQLWQELKSIEAVKARLRDDPRFNLVSQSGPLNHRTHRREVVSQLNLFNPSSSTGQALENTGGIQLDSPPVYSLHSSGWFTWSSQSAIAATLVPDTHSFESSNTPSSSAETQFSSVGNKDAQMSTIAAVKMDVMFDCNSNRAKDVVEVSQWATKMETVVSLARPPHKKIIQQFMQKYGKEFFDFYTKFV